MSFIRDAVHKRFNFCCMTAATLAAVCWGGSWVITKGALETVAAPTLLVIELIVGSVFLWGLLFVRGSHRFSFREFARLGTPGLLGLGLSNTLELAGLSLTTASSAALVKSTETILIVVAAWLFLREKQGRLVFLFAFLSFAGVGLISSNEPATVDSTGYLGSLLVLAAAGCGTVFFLLSKRDSAQHDTLRLSAAHLAWGLLWAIALLLIEVGRGNTAVLVALEPASWGLAVVAGVTEYALPYWFFLIAVKTLRTGLAPFFLTLIPVFSIIGGYLFLGERLFAAQWFGAGLIFAALIGVTGLTNDNAPAEHEAGKHPTLDRFEKWLESK